MCICDDRDIVSETVKVDDCETRGYQYGPGRKLSFKTLDEKFYHTVIFENSPLYEYVNKLNSGDFCIIKAEMKKTGVEHSLVSLFQINRLE